MVKCYTFTGTHSTGKTTVLDILTTELTDYNFIKSITRKVSKDHTINSQGNDDTQKAIINHINDYYVKNIDEINTKNSVMDRCIIDTLAYTMYLFDTGRVSSETLELCRKLLEENISRYNHVFYFKTEFDLIQDGVREDNDDFRNEVERHIENILKTYNISYTLIAGTPEQRAKTILDIIKSEEDIVKLTRNDIERAINTDCINKEFAKSQLHYQDTILGWNFNSEIYGLSNNDTLKGVLTLRVENNLGRLVSLYKLVEEPGIGSRLLKLYFNHMKYKNTDYSMIYINDESLNFYKKNSIIPLGKYKSIDNMSVAFIDNKKGNSLMYKEIPEHFKEYVNSKCSLIYNN